MSKVAKRSFISLLVCLLLCLTSMIGTRVMITDGGKVEINDLKIAINTGNIVRFLEYRPVGASTKAPVPAVIYSPGNDSTAESVRLCSAELARRGFAVYVPDLLSAGQSSESTKVSPTYGFSELIDYVYNNLSYVDKAKIGIAGYSKGAGNVVRVLTDYGNLQRKTPGKYVKKVSAALIMAPPYSPLDKLATGINLGFGAGLYDPYSRMSYKPVKGYWPGDLSVKTETKEIVNLGVPGTFSKDDLHNPNVKVQINHVYGNFAQNNARVIINPSDSTHGSGMFSREFIQDTVSFFSGALGAPNPIDPSNMVFPLLMFFSALGVLAVLALTVPLALLLLQVPVFAKLRQPAQAPVSGLQSRKDWIIFIVAAVIGGFVPPIMAPVIIQQTSKIFSLTGQGTNNSSVFVYGLANNVVVWMMFSAVFLLAMFFTIYNLINKKNGAKLSDYNLKISLENVGRVLLMAVFVVLLCRSVAWFADYFFKVDFRFVDLTFPAMSWSHLKVSLCYAPFFIIYWCINSLIMNGCNRFKGMSERLNLLICVLCNILGTIVVVIVYYTVLARTGAGIGSPSNWKAYMMLCYMIITATAGTIINRKIYNATSNLYLGPTIFGIMIAIINTAVYTLPA